MRITVLIAASLISANGAFAGDIRRFDIKTIERLGNELTEVSQRLISEQRTNGGYTIRLFAGAA